MTDAKICGLTTPEAIAAAARSGAGYIGFVFFLRMCIVLQCLGIGA